MKKEFIPYEQALALKELGFDEPCLSSFNENKTICLAPLYQQAFRWFREKHNICGYIIETTNKYNKLDGKFQYGISNSYYDVYDTYEEAELACLNKLIEIVKNK
jgi:hypothetical protein